MRLIEPACHRSYQIGQLTGNLIRHTVGPFLIWGEA